MSMHQIVMGKRENVFYVSLLHFFLEAERKRKEKKYKQQFLPLELGFYIIKCILKFASISYWSLKKYK